MNQYSTVKAAKELGISVMTLHRYMRAKKIPVPMLRYISGVRIRLWSEEDLQRVRELMPKLPDGRKTRWQKQRSQQPQPKAVPNKKRGKRK